jgi:hypothetical protein
MIPNFKNDISRIVSGVNMLNNNNTRNSDKKKEKDHSEIRAGMKKTSKIGLQLFSRWDQVVESMSTRSDSTSLYMDRKGCSILKVMAELHSIPRVTIEDDFHDFVTEYLSLKRKREMR